MDRHWARQVDQINPNEINYDYVIRFENLNEEIAGMLKDQNIWAAKKWIDEKINSSGHNEMKDILWTTELKSIYYKSFEDDFNLYNLANSK